MIESKLASLLESLGLKYLAYLPCERIKGLLGLLSSRFKMIPLSREEEGIGICSGLWLAGIRSGMIIQSSGFGNLVNALCSLGICYGFPIPILISWRGVFGEKIPAQIPLGKNLPKLLESLGLEYMIFDGKNFQELESMLENCFKHSQPKIVLLRPDIWGNGDSNIRLDLNFGDKFRSNRFRLGRKPKPKYTRYQILRGIREELKGKLVVCNLGYPSRELYWVQDQPSNFYMLGSMGLASSIALGLSLGSPEREVIAIEGDGSILMNPSSLFTIGWLSPRNLRILAIDNGVYATTGNQPTATGFWADLGLLAKAAGIPGFRARDISRIRKLLKIELKSPSFIHALALPGNAQLDPIPLSPQEIKLRFMKFVCSG